jgi:hypothetical protein
MGPSIAAKYFVTSFSTVNPDVPERGWPPSQIVRYVAGFGAKHWTPPPHVHSKPVTKLGFVLFDVGQLVGLLSVPFLLHKLLAGAVAVGAPLAVPHV